MSAEERAVKRAELKLQYARDVLDIARARLEAAQKIYNDLAIDEFRDMRLCFLRCDLDEKMADIDLQEAKEAAK
jgi:hypothetical protein